MSLTGTKLASKYMVGPKIGSGSFGQVYVVNQMGTANIYALKKQDQKTKHSQLFVETKILKQLQGCVGFSQIYWQGTQSRSNILVMDMLGPSLQDLFELCDKRFSMKTTLMLADQMIKRIQQLHSKNFIHRDIKPQNFLMGIGENSHIVYVIDFGLSKKYRDFKTHQHIPYKQNKSLTGTARYASINAHLGIEQSRRDDLQAIGYVLLYFSQGYLPWQGIKANNKNEKYQKIMEKKMSIPIQIQCEGLPIQFATYLNYCRSLKFQDKPDYAFLRRLFRELLQKQNEKYDYMYDWCVNASSQSNSRKFNNGKIKIQLRGNQKEDLLDEEKCDGENEMLVDMQGQAEENKTNNRSNVRVSGSNGNSMAVSRYAPSSKAAPNRESEAGEDDQEQILEGEQNLDDEDMVEEQIGAKADIGDQMDLEDKKNQLNYDDEESIIDI